MSINLYYYNPVIKFNDTHTKVSFKDLLDFTIVKEEDERFKETCLGEYSLLRMKLPSQNRDENDRAFFMADYRNRKPKIGVKRTDAYSEIDSDVFETTTCFYQHTSNLFIMGYNHYGAKVASITSYFNEFLPEEWTIEFLPLEPETNISDVFDSTDIRLLEIKMDLNSSSSFIQNLELENEASSLIQTIIHNTSKTQELIGGNIATLSFGNGRFKLNNLKSLEIKNILRVLDLDSELFLSIKIKYFSPLHNKVIDLDLKNASILKHVLEVDYDAWESVTKAMEDFFYDGGRFGANQFLNRGLSLQTVEQDPFSGR